MTATKIEKKNYWTILHNIFFKLCKMYSFDEKDIDNLFFDKGFSEKSKKNEKIITNILVIHGYLHMLYGKNNDVIYNYFKVKRKILNGNSFLEYIEKNKGKAMDGLILLQCYLKKILY